MLVRALLQTSLVLWLAQQTLQGGVGVKPQSVSWGRVLPARGVGIGVKPGVAGALGALGSRYGSKAMKTGIGRYPGAQLGVGGYRALGLGGRAGLKQATPGAYGASLGPGMALGAGHTNGLGLGLGQGGKRVYGAGLGALPGYGALAGIGYPGARPGVSAADLGGPELASLSQAVQHLKREKSTALGFLNGNGDRTLVPEMPVGRGIVLGPSTPVLQAEVKSLDPVVKSSSLGSTIPLEASRIQRGESYDPTVLKTKSTASHGATLPAGGVQQQLPLKKNNIIRQISASSQVQSARDHDSTIQQSQQAQNYRSTGDLSDILEINCRERLGSETQGTQSLVPQPQVSKDSKLGHATPQGQRTYPLPRSQTHDVRSHISSRPLGQGTRNYLYAVTDREGVKDLGLAAKDRNGLRIRGTIAVEKRTRGSLNLKVEGRGGYGQVFPGTGGSQGLDIASVERQEARGFTAGGQEAKHLLHAEWDVTEPKALNIPGQTGRNNQATSYIGGAGSYLGAPLGAGGYGTGLGQGAYLGGAAGKLGAAAAALGQGGYPQGAAGISNGYGEGATGYLGAVAGNGFGGDGGAKALSAGYGNGYSDGYGAGLGNPAELADGAENKAGKREALSTGGYAGQVQGAYGALGTGLESTGGKYGGAAAQVPYGNAPVIPTGLEGDGGYPYSAQHLSLGAEGAKTTNKYGAGVGYGAQQTGYGAQLGVTQDGLGEPAGKYGGVNAALGNGYKG